MSNLLQFLIGLGVFAVLLSLALAYLFRQKPILAIELDDSSHSRLDRIARDSLVDSVLATASLPILHVTAKSSYDPAALLAAINGAIAEPQSQPAPSAVRSLG